jgi:hypothetical protein
VVKLVLTVYKAKMALKAQLVPMALKVSMAQLVPMALKV